MCLWCMYHLVMRGNQRLSTLLHTMHDYPACFYMMTSSNGNIFRVTGPLCGEFTGELPAQRPVTRRSNVFFDMHLNKRLSKQPWAGDLRRHRAHCDVTVVNFFHFYHTVGTEIILFIPHCQPKSYGHFFSNMKINTLNRSILIILVSAWFIDLFWCIENSI